MIKPSSKPIPIRLEPLVKEVVKKYLDYTLDISAAPNYFPSLGETYYGLFVSIKAKNPSNSMGYIWIRESDPRVETLLHECAHAIDFMENLRTKRGHQRMENFAYLFEWQFSGSNPKSTLRRLCANPKITTPRSTHHKVIRSIQRNKKFLFELFTVLGW